MTDVDDDAPPAPMFDGTQPCASVDPEMWFPKQGENAGVAKTICGACPFREPCLAWGAKHERYGIWGGMNATQLSEIRKARRIVVVDLIPLSGDHIADENRCGTFTGYRYHHRNRTPLCRPCIQANARYEADKAARGIR